MTASLPRQLESLVIRAASHADAPSSLPPDLDADIDDGSIARSSTRHEVHSRPAVDAFRGVEAILPRGELEVELEAGAVHLAALLAAGCRVVAKLWHEDIGATPSKVLLGVCSIPLSQLLGAATAMVKALHLLHVPMAQFINLAVRDLICPYGGMADCPV